MQLVLSVGGKVLDRVEIKIELSQDEDYIDAMRRLLVTKNELSIIALQNDPQFYIEAKSKLNRPGRKSLKK